MTNKEAMVNLSDEAFFDKLHWLTHVYGKGFTDSRTAIIKWLGREAEEPDRVCVVRCWDCIDWDPPTKEDMEKGKFSGYCTIFGMNTKMDWFCADGTWNGIR